MQLAVAAAPEHAEAWALLADALGQFGSAAESANWRNACRYAAQELREGKRVLPPRSMLSPVLVPGLTTELLLDYLTVRLNLECGAGLWWSWFAKLFAFAQSGAAPDALASSRRTLEGLVLGILPLIREETVERKLPPDCSL
jgi:alkyl sulfatase BDS1-like metallo-beta-lactamase superfamily hydrolase